MVADLAAPVLAWDIDPDSDLGACVATWDAGTLTSSEIAAALDAGPLVADGLVVVDLIDGTALALRGHIALCGAAQAAVAAALAAPDAEMIRKLLTVIEETVRESGPEMGPPTRRAAALAVVENSFAGRHVNGRAALTSSGAAATRGMPG
ncbi:MAG TPA: amino acid synthesis family protein [Acetobacteraceae bacterium]|jgi:hypothetical protein|nr:amino acid synthesis family protein [Acetobacteraceae bacterium]